MSFGNNVILAYKMTKGYRNPIEITPSVVRKYKEEAHKHILVLRNLAAIL